MSDEVRVVVPCTRHLARVARTAAAACGAVAGFSVDELGDIRLLVDEVFAVMYERGAALVDMRMTVADGRLGVLMDALGPIGERRGDVETSFAERLASVVATEVGFGLCDPRPSFTAHLVAAR